MIDTLLPQALADLDAWWRAANYLTVGQIYLQDNPLLREPLRVEHIKPRLLGHWGTSPGLSLVYAHVNRLIRDTGASALFLAGPGHGGPAVIANSYLEGTWTERYPKATQDLHGMRELFRRFSTPGGVPSHVGPTTPGSIHEGGELGYVLSHAFGAVFDNPELLAIAVVGDGEAETAPLEGAWKSVSFLDAARDGAVLPIVHLNGHKISGPTVFGRTDDDALRSLFEGHGYEVYFVEGDDPTRVHQSLAAAFDAAYQKIQGIQLVARRGRLTSRPGWPMIVLRTPKGWTGPKRVDGHAVEGTFRSHQVPLSKVRESAEQLAMLDTWLRSYRPEELFDERGTPVASVLAQAPKASLRMSANAAASGGIVAPLALPAIESYALEVTSPGVRTAESTRALGAMLRDIFTLNQDAQNFRLFCPDETNSNRLGAVFEVENRALATMMTAQDDHVAPSGRVMEVLSEHLSQGWLEGYLLTGRHGLFASYEAFAMIVASMATQHAKWLEMCQEIPWRKPVASLNYLLTSTCWRNDHNGFSHQGPGFLDTLLSKKASIVRAYLPPDANCLLSVAEHCFRSENKVNLIIIDKQPQKQWLALDAAKEHCERGASVWRWAGNDDGDADVVLACAGDVPTLETVAAAQWLRENAPSLRVRVVNVVNLLCLAPADKHPNGLEETRFSNLFTTNTDVVFAFHGYAGAIHQLLHGRPAPERFHVRGYSEEGSTTTPFDMVVRNGISRFHLVKLALQFSRRAIPDARALAAKCDAALEAHRAYICEHFEDMPEIRDWSVR